MPCRPCLRAATCCWWMTPSCAAPPCPRSWTWSARRAPARWAARTQPTGSSSPPHSMPIASVLHAAAQGGGQEGCWAAAGQRSATKVYAGVPCERSASCPLPQRVWRGHAHAPRVCGVQPDRAPDLRGEAVAGTAVRAAPMSEGQPIWPAPAVHVSEPSSGHASAMGGAGSRWTAGCGRSDVQWLPSRPAAQPRAAGRCRACVRVSGPAPVQVLGADGLLYQSIEDLVSVGRELNPSIANFDTSCFTGPAQTCLLSRRLHAVLAGCGPHAGCADDAAATVQESM